MTELERSRKAADEANKINKALVRQKKTLQHSLSEANENPLQVQHSLSDVVENPLQDQQSLSTAEENPST
ncbi:hypothetical protein CHS0354_028210 [Potamilus streckersoni]|uniref:Uncharacterized protein n=1 Tax=Potamilus streckersoni TaxID=2493646 RepID=A0AAE0T603_9BIVA|nr:hypothetical protein CHS0354_028210 [Potamilus streckersoni]